MTTFDSNANVRRHSEGATLVFAVAVAVALGIACGIWINSLLAASAGRAAPAPLPPVARADTPPPADETGTAQGSNETADAESKTEPSVTAVETLTSKPAAREANPQPTADARPSPTPGIARRAASEREAVRAMPCALYASAGSLTLRGGGAAPLVLGGPGEPGRVTVNTPDWSNIAVLYEGRTGTGWLRYSVRSVSSRAGVYTVRFATPCGSKTIPVIVK